MSRQERIAISALIKAIHKLALGNTNIQVVSFNTKEYWDYTRKLENERSYLDYVFASKEYSIYVIKNKLIVHCKPLNLNTTESKSFYFFIIPL